VVGREEECGNQSSPEERCSVREFLTGAITRHRRTYTRAKCEKGEERKCNICIINTKQLGVGGGGRTPALLHGQNTTCRAGRQNTIL
jgi:hypothetical protein